MTRGCPYVVEGEAVRIAGLLTGLVGVRHATFSRDTATLEFADRTLVIGICAETGVWRVDLSRIDKGRRIPLLTSFLPRLREGNAAAIADHLIDVIPTFVTDSNKEATVA